jgi:hypothetical protein
MDEEPVVGLDAHLLEMDVVQEDKPEYDNAAQRLEKTEVIDAEAGSLLFLKGQALEVAGAFPGRRLPDGKRRLKMGQGVAGTVAARGEAMIANDLAASSPFLPAGGDDRVGGRPAQARGASGDDGDGVLEMHERVPVASCGVKTVAVARRSPAAPRPARRC